MSTENDFNRLLSSQLKKLEPEYYKLKVAEKYHEGVSDFFIWGQGRCAALEVKLVRELPKRHTTLVLGHAFDPVQITFLENVALAGSSAYGLVANEYERKLRLFKYNQLPANGNWTRQEYEDPSLVFALFPWPSDREVALRVAQFVTSTI